MAFHSESRNPECVTGGSRADVGLEPLPIHGSLARQSSKDSTLRDCDVEQAGLSLGGLGHDVAGFAVLFLSAPRGRHQQQDIRGNRAGVEFSLRRQAVRECGRVERVVAVIECHCHELAVLGFGFGNALAHRKTLKWDKQGCAVLSPDLPQKRHWL